MAILLKLYKPNTSAVEGGCEELEDELVEDLIIEGASSRCEVKFRFHLFANIYVKSSTKYFHFSLQSSNPSQP